MTDDKPQEAAVEPAEDEGAEDELSSDELEGVSGGIDYTGHPLSGSNLPD